MPFSIEQTTEKLNALAEILFGSAHHYDRLTNTHPGKNIIDKRMSLLMQSPYWANIKPLTIEAQFTDGVYQATLAEEQSLQSLSNYIIKQIQTINPAIAATILNSWKNRKRGSAKKANILEKDQNNLERYLTALRSLLDDPYEQTTTFLNPLRKNITLSDDAVNFGIATYSYLGAHYSVHLIAAALWNAASDEQAERTTTLSNLSKEEALLTSKENFIDVLVECMRAYSQDNKHNAFNSADNPSCDGGSVERLLLRGAPFNKCFLPPPEEAEHEKLIQIKQSVDHYLIDALDTFCTEADKALLFRVITNKILMEEPTIPAEEAYTALLLRYQNSLTFENHATTLYDYLSKALVEFPWQTQADSNLLASLFQLLEARIKVLNAIELDDPNGLMNAENKNSLNRILMLTQHSVVNDTWIETYQTIDSDEIKAFEQNRMTLKALEALIDAEYSRCAIEPGLFDTQKTQQRLNYFLSAFEEKKSYFATDISKNIKEKIDELTAKKLESEFGQTTIRDTKPILYFTLKTIDDRLQRLDEKLTHFSKESITTRYQTSLETLWDHTTHSEHPLLSIAPQTIHLNQEHYRKLTEKQQRILAWSLYIANVSTFFETSGNLINREKDILRGIAAMLGRTLDSLDLKAETFNPHNYHFSEEAIEEVIWIACSIIRELEIPTQQKQMAWSSLDTICKQNEVFSRHITFECIMEKIREMLNHHDAIWQELPQLFTKLGKAEEKIDSVTWNHYASFFSSKIGSQSVAWFSILSIMSSLKLNHLHVANTQAITLYCKLFTGSYANFTDDEKASHDHIMKSTTFEPTLSGLARYLQQISDLVKTNPEFHAAFSEGTITAMPRERAEQLVTIVRTMTKKAIFCTRLSSTYPNQIAFTILLENAKPQHFLCPLENFSKTIKERSFSNIKISDMHRIMPGDNFDSEKILKNQKQNYTTVLNTYVKPINAPSLVSTLECLNKGGYTAQSTSVEKNTSFFKKKPLPVAEAIDRKEVNVSDAEQARRSLS